MKRIAIVGAGGQGAIVADILGARAAGFVDAAPALHDTTILGLPVFASEEEVEHDAVIVAIGDNEARRAITERLVRSGERIAVAAHASASIAASSTIGEGCMISAGAIVLPHATLGRGVLLNTKASVDHDCFIGDFVHIGPGATLGGRVHVGDGTFIGPGVTVAAGIRIGARVVVGAGAVVLRDLPDDVTAWGVPARVTSGRRSEAPTR